MLPLLDLDRLNLFWRVDFVSENQDAPRATMALAV
jgi:hypothetical protein